MRTENRTVGSKGFYGLRMPCAIHVRELAEIKLAFQRRFIVSGLVDTVGIGRTADGGYALLITGEQQKLRQAPSSFQGLPVLRRTARPTVCAA